MKAIALNFIDYNAALEIQRACWRQESTHLNFQRTSGMDGFIDWILFEPSPVWTVGKAFKGDLFKTYPLLRQGIDAVEFVDRGGDVTYHGPGQIVAFPLPALSLSQSDRDAFVRLGPKSWVCALQKSVIHVASQWVTGLTIREGFPGVWTQSVPHQQGGKLASIGLRFSRQAISHGVSINVDPRVHEGFSKINPCGLQGVRAVDLSSLCQQSVLYDVWTRAWSKTALDLAAKKKRPGTEHQGVMCSLSI